METEYKGMVPILFINSLHLSLDYLIGFSAEQNVMTPNIQQINIFNGVFKAINKDPRSDIYFIDTIKGY